MSYRQDFKTPERSDEELANMLAVHAEDSRRIGAEAELRLREHRAIIRQAEAAERSALAADRAAAAAERQADATADGAAATIRYAKYTFWILVAAMVTAVAAIAAIFKG
jgi:hypothetical protein